jgi:hypothetical protein
MINSESNIAIVRHCSNCGSSQVRRTQRSNKMDRFLSKMNLYPYYCQDCDARSYRFGRK